MTELAIDVQHVVKRYAEHVAVKDLTLAVPKGTVYGLLGPNGAGKTTTIRMILNIIATDEGSIRVLGAASSDPRITDRIGYLPEERREEYVRCHKGGYKALKVMEKQLEQTPYLVGDQYSIADITLYAYTHVAHQGGFDLSTFPAINAWLARVADHPRHVGMQE